MGLDLAGPEAVIPDWCGPGIDRYWFRRADWWRRLGFTSGGGSGVLVLWQRFPAPEDEGGRYATITVTDFQRINQWIRQGHTLQQALDLHRIASRM